MKKILIGLAAIVVLLIAAVFIVPSVINWKSYEPEIAKAVRDATGRELHIDGDISVSVLPLSVSIGEFRLSNVEGMSSPDMISVAGVDVKLALFPLIGGSVIVESLVVREPAIFLEVDESGRPNWLFEPAAPAPAAPAPAAPAPAEAGLPISGLELADVRIEGGLFSFIDATTGQTVQARDIDIKIALANLTSTLTIVGSAVLNDENVTLDVSVDSPQAILGDDRAKIKFTLATKHVSITYDGDAQQKPVPGLDGSFDVDVPSVGALAAWLGRPLDASQPDPGPLTVHATFAADGAKVALNEATIEGKALKANAKGSFDGSGEVARFAVDVVVELADLNAYLPPEKEGEAAAEAEAAPAGKKTEGWSEEPIDFSPLKQANGEAKITIGKILYKEVTIENGVITVSVQNGVLNAAIDKLGMAGGTVDTKVTIDASQPKAALAYQATIANMQVLPLLKSFAGTDRLSGTANFNANGQAVGSNQKQIVETLNGGGGFKFLDGAIHGINIAETIRSLGSLGFGEEGPPQKTDFAEISGTFNIVNGLLENRDFQMLAPLLRVTGAGLVPLPPQTVDYNAELKLVASTEGQGSDAALAGLPIPVSITGPWADPSYDVDWGSVLGAAALDPARLAAMPDDMLEAAKGFGVDLPLPDLVGGAGSGESSEGGMGIGGWLDTVFGDSSQETTTEEPAKEDKSLLEDAGDALKSLFGN